MEDITQNFGTLYHPVSALVIYQTKGMNKTTYVEHFDMDRNGNPINAHPLTEREAKALAKALNTEREKSKAFLRPEGVMPIHILYVNPSDNGAVMWFTKAMQTQLFFSEGLGIANGIAEVPALLWQANKHSLTLFALATNRRPNERTALYHAPFLNVYEGGNVCMGTVDVNIKNSASIEEFTSAWQGYFFNSYFSHLVNGHNPIIGNCVSLWKELVGTGKPFPNEVLKKTNRTLKNILP